MANPIQFEPRTKAGQPDCQLCEELLADAVDGILSPADKSFFDLHLSTCATCNASLAEAVRGATWLELLKAPRPEPAADLVNRIMQQTSGYAPGHAPTPEPQLFFNDPQPATRRFEPVLVSAPITPSLPANVLSFRSSSTQARRNGPSMWGSLQRLAFEPRLAMTAAMAFFSIALTMNVTGVRLDQLHAKDLSPSTLRHGYYAATASVARRYDSLRVVHVLESRVEDIRELNSEDAGSKPTRRTDPAPQRQAAPEKQGKPDSPKSQSGQDHGVSHLNPAVSEPATPIQNSSSSIQPAKVTTTVNPGGLA